jgi:hypothetical protein
VRNNNNKPEMEPGLVQALANSTNGHRVMAAPLSGGTAWSASEFGKLVDLTAGKGTIAGGRSRRRSRHDDNADGCGSDWAYWPPIKEEDGVRPGGGASTLSAFDARPRAARFRFRFT